MKIATPLVDGLIWVVQDESNTLATITLSDNRYLYSEKKESRFFDNLYQLQTTLNIDFSQGGGDANIKAQLDIYGYPTNCEPKNVIYDLSKKFYIYSKTETSTSFYCAGYFLIKFDKRWGKAFCPKLITLEKYEFIGPFKTNKEALRTLNNERSRTH
jgi:hypothetical protein